MAVPAVDWGTHLRRRGPADVVGILLRCARRKRAVHRGGGRAPGLSLGKLSMEESRMSM